MAGYWDFTRCMGLTIIIGIMIYGACLGLGVVFEDLIASRSPWWNVNHVCKYDALAYNFLLLCPFFSLPLFLALVGLFVIASFFGWCIMSWAHNCHRRCQGQAVDYGQRYESIV